jgi:hypothetical protein
MFLRQNKAKPAKEVADRHRLPGDDHFHGDNQDKLDVFGANRRASEEIARR